MWASGDSAMASLRRESEQADRNRPPSGWSYLDGTSYEDYKNKQEQWQEARDRRKNDEATRQAAINRQISTGVILLSVGVIVEVGSFIYGFVAPAVHLKRARANAVAANDTGFKFNLAYTSSGNIAPQLSYKIRY